MASHEPLSDEEIEKLRTILKQDERVEWLYASIRRYAAWVFGVAAALVAFRADITALFGWLFYGPRP
jgi:hypothetical protein